MKKKKYAKITKQSQAYNGCASGYSLEIFEFFLS